MGGAIRLGRLAGIQVYVHGTFFLLLLWIALATYVDAGPKEALLQVAFVVAIFAAVVLHEFGHALTARRFGIRTRDITLLPIGGVARLERMPSKPTEELLVALAGPAVNLGLGFAFLGVAHMMSFADDSFVYRYAVVNLVLAFFNLLPAFPMDGGRVLRALLTSRMDAERSTQIAAGAGRAMAVLMFVGGIYFNPLLILIAIFVWFGANQELRFLRVASALQGRDVRSVMTETFDIVGRRDLIAQVEERMLRDFQPGYPVVDAGQFVGTLSPADVLRSPTKGPQKLTVEAFMRTDIVPLKPKEPLEIMLQRCAELSCDWLPVVDDGRVVGIVDMRRVNQLVLRRVAHNDRARTAVMTNSAPHEPSPEGRPS